MAGPGYTTPKKVTIVGRGQVHAPKPGKTALPGLFPLRRAALKALTDTPCGRLWKRSATKYRNRFEARSDLCATDSGGGSPRDSVCAGDSGGPMIAGTLKRPILIGVISWTGPRCGADKLPSVAADTRYFHDFLTDPAPTWAPVAAGSLRVLGAPRVGERLTCVLPEWEQPPAQVEVKWRRRITAKDGAYRMVEVGRATSYTVAPDDAGCWSARRSPRTTAGGHWCR